MGKLVWTALVLVVLTCAPAAAQSTSRDATREQVRSTLLAASTNPDVHTTFRQSTKNEYNFVGSMTTGLTYCDYLEIVVSVTKSDTIGVRVYPHYKGGYINLDRASNPAGLMRQLLYFSDQNFLFWGADDTHDVFSGYTVTLESGFPREAFIIVLRSIHNTDKFVGDLRPFLT